MRTRHLSLLAIVAVVLVAGCSSNNKGKIEDTKWVNVATTVKGKPLPAGILRLEFDASGKLRFGTFLKMNSGTWKLNNGDYVTLSFDQEVSGRKKHREKIVIEGDKLTMTDSDGKSLTFKRADANAKAPKPPANSKKPTGTSPFMPNSPIPKK